MARTETFEATRPDGTVVVVTRNIETGEQTVVERGAEAPAAAPAAEAETPAEPVKRKPGRPKKSE